jgi:hypothetical protein
MVLALASASVDAVGLVALALAPTVAATTFVFGGAAPCSSARSMIRAVRTDVPRPPSSPGSVVAAISARAEIPPAPGSDIVGRRAAAERRSCEYIADSRRTSMQLRSRSG